MLKKKTKKTQVFTSILSTSQALPNLVKPIPLRNYNYFCNYTGKETAAQQSKFPKIIQLVSFRARIHSQTVWETHVLIHYVKLTLLKNVVKAYINLRGHMTFLYFKCNLL